ncbi:MAG: hypothetical protein Q7J34_03005 [Bacteroidales bacterium]|nr:hypothetical protein [Bacteroidales bacterium]
MQKNNSQESVLIDGSRLMIEAMARAGADTFIGYPITPANLLYLYATQRFELMLPAPDEITTIQWMTGLAATGRIPVTATSFPGFALMIESINMAYMMELPMVIVLAQRLGPATGTATCGAQGDIALLRGMYSGGFSIPVFSPSAYSDSWTMAGEAVRVAIKLRTPVVLLTSKEEVMTHKNFDISHLPEITATQMKGFDLADEYRTYANTEDKIPPFLAVPNNKHQIRITASTHDTKGILQHSTEEAIDNTLRLQEKTMKYLDDFTHYDLDEQAGATKLLISFGITALAALDAVNRMRTSGEKISLLTIKTLLPVPPVYYEIMDKYSNIIIAEENSTAQYSKILFGDRLPKNVTHIGTFGRMITPSDIINGGAE